MITIERVIILILVIAVILLFLQVNILFNNDNRIVESVKQNAVDNRFNIYLTLKLIDVIEIAFGRVYIKTGEYEVVK